MATIVKTPVWKPGEPFAPYITVTEKEGTRVILRQNARRPPNKISLRQQLAMNALTATSRAFKQTLTAAQRLKWGTKGDTLIARDGRTTSKWGMTRWTQVQMPLYYIGKLMELTNQQRNQTQLRSLQITDYDIESNQVELSWEWRRSGTSQERVVMHVHQVPPQHIGTEHLWSYALLSSSFQQYLQLTLDIWYPMSHWFVLSYQIKAGSELQLYIRINNFKNINPPITKQSSTLSVEDWTALITQIE